MSLNEDKFYFGIALKVLPTEGNLVYEYNPFYNYRIDQTMILYLSRLWTLEDFWDEFANSTYKDAYVKDDDGNDTDTTYKEAFLNGTFGSSDEDGSSMSRSDWQKYFDIPSTETTPVVYQEGELVDFDTDELSFSLNNPVNLAALWSYDNSVNLVINDGLNPPRLINSRFSPTERHQYLVCNRKGDNDTNIYDMGELFDVDTSLYKKMTTIPRLTFTEITYGGNLACGNYFFYFKYEDEDGNESDFFAESGLVSIFIGNTADSSYTGFENENAHKSVKFILSNTDPGYLKIRIYYTRSSGAIQLSSTLNAYRIEQDYYIADSGSTVINITGYETTTETSTDEINAQYQVYGSAETLEECQNMLFLANVDKVELDYDDLADCALRFMPYIVTEDYDYDALGYDYSGSSTNTYYNANYIYKKTGYWDDEIYRFGVVFIMEDLTLSPVFNVRGLNYLQETSAGDSSTTSSYTDIDFWTDDDKAERNYINYDPVYFNILNEAGETTSGTASLENAKGVVRISVPDQSKVLGINFKVKWEVIQYLQNTLKVKGMFFVRLKRIPTTLCQAYIIGIDKESYTPVLPVEGHDYNDEIEEGELAFLSESFLSPNEDHNDDWGHSDWEDREMNHEFELHQRVIESYQVRQEAAICPEYDVTPEFFNNLFTGALMVCRNCVSTHYLTNSNRHFYPEDFNFEKGEGYTTIKVIGVLDDTKLASIGEKYFRGRAGEAEEAFRFEFLGEENKDDEADNLLRGIYGPFLGITGYENAGHLVDIKIPGFLASNMEDYFTIRYNDKLPFYAISDRIDFSEPTDFFLQTVYNEDSNGKSLTEDASVASMLIQDDPEEYYVKLQNTIYRGDCYICQVTHRVNRNFLDPSAPTNEEIVDPDCWEENFNYDDEVLDTEEFDDINLGDVNAVGLGMWVTLVVRSTYNLNIRSIDKSNTDEYGLTGHFRAFYPYYSLSVKGVYKIPEALCINKGFQTSVSARTYYEVPDVPWIKNEFSNRIAYSNVLVQDAFQNGWRTFKGLNYRDYPKTYGSITKLVEWGGNLICVLEHGVYKIAINERTLTGGGEGGNVYVNTNNVLPQGFGQGGSGENPNVLSDMYGSQWRESVIKTDKGIYGVDTISKKIWFTDGTKLTVISDSFVEEFLNLHISLAEREMTPIIGIRNVKTHWNRYKDDVMFTFYDDVYSFEETVWNLCYNQTLNKWITFYSWVPSYSENIYNQYFSFDRNTSKYIAKLGTCKAGNDFSDGVTLSDTIINDVEDEDGNLVWEAELSLSNRTLDSGVEVESYELVRDVWGNYKYFDIYSKDITTYTDSDGNEITEEEAKELESNECTASTVTKHYLVFTGGGTLNSDGTVTHNYTTTYTDLEGNEITLEEAEELGEGNYKEIKNTTDLTYEDLCSEFYYRYNSELSEETKVDSKYTIYTPDTEGYNLDLEIYVNDAGKRCWLPDDLQKNSDKIVRYLNIRANVTTNYDADATLEEYYATGDANIVTVDSGYYESTIAVMPYYNMQFLSTDFWKHGQAGIIDIADKIYPTYWYGKQHPFEVEFIVADNPDRHKIFNNLKIISNNAEPESFHYEIVGDSLMFSKDKKNMYIRQEATKELFQYNGCDITYDHDYDELESTHRTINATSSSGEPMYDRSTLMPLYYSRQDAVNEIEDYYHLKDGENTRDFSALAGGEVVHYTTLDEYRIWNHCKAVDIEQYGRLRGNMQYREDIWYVLINPINIVQCNEPKWTYTYTDTNSNTVTAETDKVPVELGLNNLPDMFNEITTLEIPDSDGWEERGYVMWTYRSSLRSECKVKDKWLKVRIRYSGEKLAVIYAIKTLYTITNI